MKKAGMVWGVAMAAGLAFGGMGLEGVWRLRLDGKDSGEARLPGTLDTNGKGVANLKTNETTHLSRRWTFGGEAEYSREVEIPREWAGREVELMLELTRAVEVLVDGKSAGKGDSLSTPHRYGLGKLEPGRHELTVKVRTEGALPPKIGGHATAPHTQTFWNGIVGRIELRAKGARRIEGLRVTPFAGQRRMVVDFRGVGLKRGEKVRVTAEPRNFAGRTVTGAGTVHGEGRMAVALEMGEDAGLWDEFAPNLYTVRAECEGAEGAEAVAGLRDFEARGRKFAVNGKEVYLRGRHDACVFPLTAHPPMDKAGWMRHLRIAKEWGLNHVRFHSWCPPKAAFEAADELGIYMQPELPVWTTLKREHREAADYMRREGLRILEEYGNHASFVAMGLGNELHGDAEVQEELVGALRAADSAYGKVRRLFTNGANNYLGKQGYFPWMDYYVTAQMQDAPYGSKEQHVRGSFAYVDAAKGGWLNDTAPNSAMNFDAAAGESAIPVVAHETGQFQAYPDYREEAKYTGVLRADNFRAFRERLERAGLGDLAGRYARDSGRWMAELYKAEIEMNLRSREMAGFELLDLQDFPGQGTALVGVLNAFMEPKGAIGAEEWRGFCSEAVPLAELERFTFTEGETAAARIKLCDYTEKGLGGREVEWKLERADGSVAAAGSLAVKAGGRGLKALGEIAPAMTPARKGKVEAARLTLRVKGTGYGNGYPLWIYPKEESGEGVGGVTVTEELTDEIGAKLEAGATVVWTPRAEAVKGASVGGMAQTDFWNWRMFKGLSEAMKREVSPGTLGLTLDAGHPLFRGFPTGTHASWQWAEIMKASRPLILDGMGAKPEVLVRVIDNVERNHDLAIVAGWRVGKGKLLACSTDFGVAGKRPEGRAFRRAVMEYAASGEFAPEARAGFEEVKSRFAR